VRPQKVFRAAGDLFRRERWFSACGGLFDGLSIEPAQLSGCRGRRRLARIVAGVHDVGRQSCPVDLSDGVRLIGGLKFGQVCTTDASPIRQTVGRRVFVPVSH